MRAKGTWGTTLHSSWLATILAGALAVTTPVAATIARDHAAPDPTTVVVRSVDGDVTGSAIEGPGGVARRRRAPAASAVPETRVLAAHPELAQTSQLPQVTRAAPEGSLIVHVDPGLVARAHPWPGAATIARVPTTSRYFHVPLRLWVEEVRRTGGRTWGLVEIPYAWPHREGWIRLDRLRQRRTDVLVRVDLSEHRVRVYRGDRLLRTFPGATGAPASPTPPGDYVVTDRVPFASGSSLGSFAFGISGVQPRLPAGWSGGDQLAIHGTNAPWTIGTSASAGCIRVSEPAIDALLPLLDRGTPVLIRP